MSGPLSGVRNFFVAPPAGGRRARPWAMPSPASFAVLGERGDALAVGNALVLASAGCGVVCAWPPAAPHRRGPATGEARRLARRLESRGLDSVPHGRMVRVALPEPPAEAVSAAQRAAAAAPVACAVVLAGPREDELDALFSLQDAIVLVVRAGPGSPLVRLAVEGLHGAGAAVAALSPPTGVARQLALAGIAALPALRTELAPALQAA